MESKDTKVFVVVSIPFKRATERFRQRGMTRHLYWVYQTQSYKI
jgi:hypothetical protein